MGFWFLVSGFWFLVPGFWFLVNEVSSVSGSLFQVPSFGFRVSGSEFRVPSFEFVYA